MLPEGGLLVGGGRDHQVLDIIADLDLCMEEGWQSSPAEAEKVGSRRRSAGGKELLKLSRSRGRDCLLWLRDAA